MSEILIVQLINFFLQISFDFIVKLLDNNCVDENEANIFTAFISTVVTSPYKLIYYFISSVVLLSIFNKKSFIANLLILILGYFPYIYIYFIIQYLGC